MPESELAILLQQWATGLRLAHIGSSRTAATYDKRRWGLGALSALVSGAVGTAVFASLSQNVGDAQTVIVGTLSVVAAILTSMNSLLDYSGRAQRHIDAATAYGGLRRELELACLDVVSPEDPRLVSINRRWQEIDAKAPTVPSRIHDWARARIQQERQGAAADLHHLRDAG